MHEKMKINLGKFIGEISTVSEEISQSQIEELKIGSVSAVDDELTKGRLVSDFNLKLIVGLMHKLEQDKRLLSKYNSFEQLMSEWEFSGVSEGTSIVILTFLEHSGLFPKTFSTLSYFQVLGEQEKFALEDLIGNRNLESNFFNWR
ncbi:hypothetical protein [Shewanella maritima]|uniref:hypothetical protein n=1 Tax=Shewanella maritima TaxID=2520507 RepID=UPI003736637E